MAGERLKPPGFTEVSAICTRPQDRGRGYARALVRRLMDEIFARREILILHVFPDNQPALRLYESIGFVVRAGLTIIWLAPAVRMRSAMSDNRRDI